MNNGVYAVYIKEIGDHEQENALVFKNIAKGGADIAERIGDNVRLLFSI